MFQYGLFYNFKVCALTMKMKTCEIMGLHDFCDIIAVRRCTSDILWASKEWIPNSVYQVLVQSHQKNAESIVLTSPRLLDILSELSRQENIDMKILETVAKSMLVEIGYRRVEPILRWLAFFTAKIFKQLYISIYVNEVKILKAISQMGKNPVLLLPSHKSYMDFTLISYLCFHYNMDIPRIAAGMDFLSMKFVKTLIRDSCAFFIRRTFNSDKLYSAVFSQYVHTLVTYGDAPIEFFIEGTRSRTEKSLIPKYGLLTMTMIPFLIGKVPDISIIPINISYDRIVEEVLLVYELLGVPKPKESTKGLWKALRLLNSNYGNVFLQFGETISVKKFFGNEIDRSNHNYGPVDLQNPTLKEREEIMRLANAIVREQQNLSVLTCFNLIASAMNNHMMEYRSPLNLNDLIIEITWLTELFRKLGAKVAVENDIGKSVSRNLNLHKLFVNVTPDGNVKLLRIHSVNNEIDRSRMKGHILSDTTMDIAVPLLLIQYYSNPCAHFLVNIAFILLIAESVDELSLEILSSHFKFLRLIYSSEFVLYPETEKKDFEYAFKFCRRENAIVYSESNIRLSDNMKLRKFCISFFRNYIPSYLTVIGVLMKEMESEVTAKSIQVAYQESVEASILCGSNLHPASLSLDLVGNALESFTRFGALKKKIKKNCFNYEVSAEKLKKVLDQLRIFSHLYNEVDLSEHFSNFITGKL